jgi:hypothetical protein
MRIAGANADDEATARKLFDLWHDGLRNGDWGAFDEAFAGAEDQSWFDNSGIAWLGERPAGDHVRTYLAMMDYDPIPALKGLEAPMLALLSPDDESIDAVETEEILRELAETGRNIEIKTYPGYNHAMRLIGARWPSHPDDYFQIQSDFIKRSVGASNGDSARPD